MSWKKNRMQEYDELLEKYDRLFADHSELKYELTEMKSHAESIENKDEEIKKLHDNMRLLKHDMKNHLMVIASYLSSEDMVAAKEYISKILDKLNSIHSYIETGNALLNHILNEKLEYAKKAGIVLIIFSFIIVMISSVFVPIASTKWAILSPIMVPMFMQSSFTPEFAQAVFRAADSSIKGITPLFTYFVILVGFLQIYNTKKKDSISLVDAIGLMVPYSIAFSILWLLILIGFYIIGLPLGFNAGVML